MHVFPIQIRFNDVDLVGHVNNVIFGHYCDAARYCFMTQALGQTIDLHNGQQILIMVHTEFDFLCPTFLDDVIEVVTNLESVGERSVRLVQEVRERQSKKVHVRSSSVMSTFDRSTSKSFPMPLEWKEAFQNFNCR